MKHTLFRCVDWRLEWHVESGRERAITCIGAGSECLVKVKLAVDRLCPVVIRVKSVCALKRHKAESTGCTIPTEVWSKPFLSECNNSKMASTTADVVAAEIGLNAQLAFRRSQGIILLLLILAGTTICLFILFWQGERSVLGSVECVLCVCGVCCAALKNPFAHDSFWRIKSND